VSIEYRVGDVFDRLAEIPDRSIHSVITSPPYWRKRRYVPEDHPEAAKEIGQEPSPGEFLATMLRLTDELWRVVRDDGTIWINLGDTAAGSGGWGGDVDKTNRGGGRRWKGVNGAGISGTPLPKSVCWIPELFGASLAYGRNLLTGASCTQWVTRPPVTWCKPSVTPGRCDDRFRQATELIVWASKRPSYYWDKAAILEPLADSPGNRHMRRQTATDTGARDQGTATSNRITADYDPAGSEGAPPFDWWVVATSQYGGAHFATFPEELIRRPVIVSCPPGGTILDPFGGSGTTGRVALAHGRNAILIDFNADNADLARERVGLFLTIAEGAPRAS
jgi:DNA modification methylase